MPNIVLIVVESLNPSTYLIDDDFIDETAAARPGDPEYYISSKPFYNRHFAPFLRELAADGVTFSGMNSLGLPTYSGWHGLLTGLVPAQNYMNIVEGSKLHVDDVPSHMRDEGYWTYYLSAQDMDFDGMRNWLYRRPALAEAQIRCNCSSLLDDVQDDAILQGLLRDQAPVQTHDCREKKWAKRVSRLRKKLAFQDYPLWFDYVETYYPSREQASLLNISKESLVFHAWVSDRISTKQFALHWRQQKENMKRKKLSKPIFAGYMNIEGHMPYHGYDREDFYDPIDPKLGFASAEHKKARYLRVNKYADQWAIGETIRFLRENDNNTIVFVTGDHGTRDVPIRWKNSPITNRTVFSGDCVGRSSGCDSIFTTTGVISYLGDDPRIVRRLGLDHLKGKTLKFATDHNDLIYTMFDITAKLQGREMKPTHRRGRNLFELGQSLLGKPYREQLQMIDESDWVGLTFVTHQIDYRRGAKNLRVHPADPAGAHLYDAVAFPTCLKLLNDPEMDVAGARAFPLFTEMLEYLNVENHLASLNKVYSYAFCNGTCIQNGNCTFPRKNEGFRATAEGLYIALLFPRGLSHSPPPRHWSH
jgi:arylsulfatase A-like enzyme